MARTHRVRDPVHGLINFGREADEAASDRIAWLLLNTPEMQRLRRIRQLGVSEFTFPGATHTRFAHSLGVFHVARQLVRVLKRLLPPEDWRADRAEVALYAALLHDVGHGPFSHAFERVQKARGAAKHHETWTAELILEPSGSIFPILEARRRGMAEEVADLLLAEIPDDPYHAIVSSSFDADRLDYLRRDRLMTGSGAGAIDFDWLIDNLAIGKVSVGTDDDETAEGIFTFCLHRKSLQAAEIFLLGRYHLFEQVYLHKTTRGMETIVFKIVECIANAAISEEYSKLGLDVNDPLVKFFSDTSESCERFAALDDTAIWAATMRMSRCVDKVGSKLAKRLINRERMPCLDVESAFPRQDGEELADAEARWQTEVDRIDALVCEDASVIKDVVTNSAYGEVGGDQAKAHKRLAILVDEGPPREITALSDLIKALPRREMVRYFFESEEARKRVLKG